jgi:hypothetical protein
MRSGPKFATQGKGAPPQSCHHEGRFCPRDLLLLSPEGSLEGLSEGSYLKVGLCRRPSLFRVAAGASGGPPAHVAPACHELRLSNRVKRQRLILRLCAFESP